MVYYGINGCDGLFKVFRVRLWLVFVWGLAKRGGGEGRTVNGETSG